MSALTPSQQLVYEYLRSMRPEGPWSPLVGTLDPQKKLLRMPLSSTDGRHRTWDKTILEIARSVKNQITDVHRDCWLVDAQQGEEFRVAKLDSGGSGNKWTYQRITFCLKNKHDQQMRTHESLVLNPVARPSHSHRCGVSFPGRYTCINCDHAYNEDQSINDSRKGCGNGCAALCPHIPLCIFTDKETGRWLSCLNDPTRLVRCDQVHDGQCWGPNAGQAAHGGHVAYSPPHSVQFSEASSQTTQTTRAGFGSPALRDEVDDTVREARGRGEWNLGSRR